MPVPFGFAAGDFLATASLIHSIVKALEESSGASAQYQGVVKALKSLKVVVTKLKDASEIPQDDPVLVDVIQGCEGTISRFLDRTRKYDRRLSSNVSRKDWRTTLSKIKWQLYSKNEVQEFQIEVQTHVCALLLLLDGFSAKANAQAHQEVQKGFKRVEKKLDQQSTKLVQQRSLVSSFLLCIQEIRHIVRSLFELVNTMRNTLSAIQRSISQLHIGFFFSVVAVFEDGHDSLFHIDANFMQTWGAFNVRLCENFAALPGAKRVRRGMFRLHDHFSGREIDQERCDFKVAFRPGRRIKMSILFEYFEINTELCPRCESANIKEIRVGTECVDCGFWYNNSSPTEGDGHSSANRLRGAYARNKEQDQPGDFARISITVEPDFDFTAVLGSSHQLDTNFAESRIRQESCQQCEQALSEFSNPSLPQRGGDD